MTERQKFQGFFSYSHLDAVVDPEMFRSFTTRLEYRVRARLVNADFSIWFDTDRLKTGYRWDERIISEVENSTVFVLLLTPKWIDSIYCRKELSKFLEVERSFDIGEYIAPLLARSIDSQTKHFDDAQREAFDTVSARQYSKILSRNFLDMTSDEREILVDRIADDIEGMIERRRSIAIESTSSTPATEYKLHKPLRRKPEFDAKAHNFEETDYITDGEIVVESTANGATKGIFVSIGFLPKLYIQTPNIRVEFGIQRAIISIEGSQESQIDRDIDFSSDPKNKDHYYLNWKAFPRAVSLCLNPGPGKATLQEMPLQPSPGENRLCKVASADSSAEISEINAVLSINLNTEGLHIFGNNASELSQSLIKKVAAITNVAINKEISSPNGKIERKLPVREKRR